MNKQLFGILLLCICIQQIAVCFGKSIVPVNQSNQLTGKVSAEVPQTTTTKRSFTCECGDTGEPVCANNGVTYKNFCKFECAKHKEERLRVVKEGNCGKYISKLQFWSFG